MPLPVQSKPAAGVAARYLEGGLAAASLIAVAVFVAVGMGRSIWLDEANCILISSRGFSGIVDGLRHDNNLPFYYFLLAGWMRIFGDSEIALRALSALFYLAGGGAAFALGKRLSGTGRGAWYSAFFYLCSPLATRQAQNIRMYAFLGMLSGLSILAFLRLFADRDRSWRAKGFFVAVNAVGILTHVWFAFFLIAQLVAILALERKQWRQFVLAAAAAAVPFLALWARYFVEQSRNGATDWMPSIRLWFFVEALVEFYGRFPALLLYGLAAGALAMAGAAKRRRLLRGSGIPLVIAILLASLALPLIVWVVRPLYWPGRYAIIALAPLAALLGALLPPIMPRALLAGFCTLLLASNVTAHVIQSGLVAGGHLPAGQSDRTTALFLLRHAAPGDAVVFTSLTRAAADYYFRRDGARQRFIEVSFPAEVAAHLGWYRTDPSPAQRRLLEAEAAGTARRLGQLASAGRRIWVYDGFKTSEILRRCLDAVLAPPTEYPLRGPYHQRLLEYGAPSGQSSERTAPEERTGIPMPSPKQTPMASAIISATSKDRPGE